MITREIKLPENYKKYFKTKDDITEVIKNYIKNKEIKIKNDKVTIILEKYFNPLFNKTFKEIRQGQNK